jgi:hypothetical protein
MKKSQRVPIPRIYEVRVEVPLRFLTFEKREARRIVKGFFELWAQAMSALLGASAAEFGRPKILSISEGEELELEK